MSEQQQQETATGLRWWIVSAGTPDGSEGERRGRIRASDETRARELYHLNRPANWTIFAIEPEPESDGAE